MLQLLRRTLLRRLFCALVLGAFVPVASATVACQVHCAGEELASWVDPATGGHSPQGAHPPAHLSAPEASHEAANAEKPANDADVTAHGFDASTVGHPVAFVDYLTHAGPCHLSAVPVVTASSPASPLRTLDRAWAPLPVADYISFVSPPPEHRPRG